MLKTILFTTALCATGLAAADSTAPAPAPATVTDPTMFTTPSIREDPRVHRARPSGKRFILNSLAGGLVGGVVGYAAFQGMGGDSIGAAFAGLGVQIAVTPAVVYGAGRLQGGQGTIGSAYLGGLIAFSGPSATTDQAAVSFAVGMLLMPFTSALMYELSSGIRSKRLEAAAQSLQVTPVVDGNGGVAGVRAGFAFGF